MKIISYKSKVGKIKLVYRRMFWLFGKRMYFIIGWNKFVGSNIKHSTFIYYENFYTAKRTFDIIKSSIMLEEEKRV